MSRGTHEILKHYYSAMENPNHEDCHPVEIQGVPITVT